VVVLVPTVRPIASRIVALDPVGCTVLVVRPVAGIAQAPAKLIS
jgi:hypothetical protein